MIARLDAALLGYGQTVTFQRTTVDATTGAVTITQSVDCPAAVRIYGPQDLLAGEVLPMRVVVSPTGIGSFGVPSRDDRVVIDGNPSNIEEISPLHYGGQLVRVNLLCRG
ncbi:MAG TPA: hypothetical protein VHM22_18525 [Bradyrhizobium sp.]|nr:hypothetical protein [Bradyrhizobium sp.]